MATIKKRELSRSALLIGIFTLLAVGSWIGFDLYRSIVKTTLPDVLQAQIQALKSTVDTETLNNLRARQRYVEAELSSVQSVAIEESAEPSITPTPSIAAEEATDSALPLTNPVATESASSEL